MVYARSPTLGLTVWFVSGNGASQRSSAQSLAETVSTGNRGTGLSPGPWKVDGGLKYLGATLTDASVHLDCTSVSDNELVGNILASSVINGSNVVPATVRMTFQRVNIGWFDDRNGYYVQQNLCTESGQCMSKAFIQENQNKMMVYARSPTLGLTVWIVSGNGASTRTSAQSLAETVSTGNRGTGLSPGAWKVDGGFKYLGQTLVDADLDLDIVAIDDNTLVGNILDSTVVNGSNVIPGGYQGVTGTFKSHNFGWFDNRNGYYLSESICLVNGQCLIE